MYLTERVGEHLRAGDPVISVDTAESLVGQRANGGRAGLANSYFWIDPTKDVCGVFLTQVFPFADEGSIGLFRDFERAVYQSM